jgi:hypothetical protein
MLKFMIISLIIEYVNVFKTLTVFIGFEVFTAVVMKSITFWDMTPCSSLSFNRRFGGTYRKLATCLLAGLLNILLRP